MPPPRRHPARKPADRYHHGNLRAALLQEAVRLIQTRGVEALTLREVGGHLGVSRTAIYRHFPSKDALLAAVAQEGFRVFRQALVEAWLGGGKGQAGFAAMGLAYVRFALEHPSHYRVMFGGGHLEPDASGEGAFGVLVEAIVEQQQAGLVRRDEPQLVALYIWSAMHGIAMLALDGLCGTAGEAEAITRFAVERLVTGIAPAACPAAGASPSAKPAGFAV